MIHIQGFCPMGCGQTLCAAGGLVYCENGACPQSTAVTTILNNPETEHIVVFFDEESFSVQHPLRERINDDLFRCDLYLWISRRSGPPFRPGRYRVAQTLTYPCWNFVKVVP